MSWQTSGYAAPNDLALSRGGSGLDLDRSADTQLLRQLLSALQDRVAVLQVLHRDDGGSWRVVHAAGSLGIEPCSATVGDTGLASLLDWIDEDDRALLALALREVAADAPPWNGRCRMPEPDGGTLWVEVGMQRLPAADTGVTVMLVARDVTPQKRVEDKLAELGEHWEMASVATGLGTLTFDVSRQLLHLDIAAAEQHGVPVPSRDGMTLDEWVALFVEEDRLKVHALISSGVHPDQTESITLRLPGPSGTPVRLLELALRSTADGLRFIGACRDVTQERSLEEMRRKKLAAEKANKSKSEFMSHVSHELRTPLNGILGFAQLMAMDSVSPLPAEQSKRLEVLTYSARRLLTLIDKLLEISKIERGKHTLRPRPINVFAIINACIAQVQPMADARGIAISVELHPDDASAVHADGGALEQVLINLLSNAVKYNRPQGKVRVRYVANEMGTIIVDDTGRGMSDTEVGRLFEPFNRLSATHSKVPGHGLGLVISRQLVESMHGELLVTSKQGVGSRFAVQLPLAADAPADVTTSLPLDLPSQWATGRHYNVLYIEDDEVNTILMEQVFMTQPEWTLITAGTGAEGIAAAVRQRPEVVLLDMNLPDMTGQEVFKRLRADPRTRQIPCVAVSADALPAHVRRTLAAGFDDYWSKPLELTTVISRLKVLLR
jgi:signal transduction histidine kinase/CheY-like chemotaxis protein